MREIIVKDAFNNALHTNVWDEVEEPLGVIQVVHGVNEHSLRYNEFAEYCNRHGYIVYCHDQLSQGKTRTVNDKDVVYFGKKGTITLKNGVISVYNQIKRDYDNLDIYAFGHSMGGSILRNVLIDNEITYKKVILSGTGLTKINGIGLIILFGNFLKLFKAKKPSKFFDNIFRQTQLRLKDKVEINHFIEWLTRDKEKNELDKKDKYLYISLSVGAFVDILKFFKISNNKSQIQKMSKDNKILLISGSHDAASNFGEDTKLLGAYYNEIDVKTKTIIYKEGRHDSLQEINRKEVYNDIISFSNNY